MNNTELIHAEFDTAIDRLIEISSTTMVQSNNLKAPEDYESIDHGKFLKSIGFGNVKTAVAAEEFSLNKEEIISKKQQLSDKSRTITNTITKYNKCFPFYKFILYSQVIAILEKYNLYLGPSFLYKGEIPAKNIKEIKAFVEHCDNFRKNGDYRNSKIFLDMQRNKPLCSWNYTKRSDTPFFYICAPKRDFKKGANIKTIGKEIYESEFSIPSIKQAIQIIESRKKEDDPIITTPVFTEFNQPGFIISTKWGLEANDSRLSVPLNN